MRRVFTGPGASTDRQVQQAAGVQQRAVQAQAR